MASQQLVSIIVPMYNEADNIRPVYKALKKVFSKLTYRCEILFVDDGSQDRTVDILAQLAHKDPNVKPINLARNFGKEIALTAGLNHASGKAAIMLDADFQHPPELIPQFIEKWEKGADLVIGVRKEYGASIFKKLTSKFFYRVMSKMSDTDLIPDATDFRLVDRKVIDAFNRFTERNRITRGLFDWLGFKRDFIRFTAKERQHGKASYSLRKLIKLSVDSFVGHSLFPLRLALYTGTIITTVSIPLGAYIFIDRYFLNDPFGYQFSSSAILAIINLTLSGITLISIGLMSLYLASIHSETANRPLYVTRATEKIRKRKASTRRA